MKFIADESVDAPIVNKLREEGFSVFAIAEHCPGIDDEQVLMFARNMHSILITQDKDFGELIFRLGRSHEGIILLRLSGLQPQLKADLTLKVITKHQKEIPGSFAVIYKELVKIRKRI